MSDEYVRPYIFGPKIWGSISNFISTYPITATTEIMESAIMFFQSLKNLMPCLACRKSYTNFILENDTDINNMYNFLSRDHIINFVFNLRNKVNKKIGLEYGITLNYYKLKLEKLVCSKTNNMSDIINNLQEAPLLPLTHIDKILKFVHENSHMIDNYNKNFTLSILKKMENFIENPIFDENNKEFNLFIKRNEICRKIISDINKEYVLNLYDFDKSFHHDKKLYVNLFYLGCSIIHKEHLDKIFI